MGRLPAWNPIGVVDHGAWLETAQFATEDRIILPIEVRRRVGWRRRTSVTHLLAVLTDSGAVELMEWEPAGRREMERVGAALGGIEGADREDALFAAMDRYTRAALARDGRLRLAPPLLPHFGSPDREAVRIAVNNGRLWIWPEHLWETRRHDRFQRLDGLITRRGQTDRYGLDADAA